MPLIIDELRKEHKVTHYTYSKFYKEGVYIPDKLNTELSPKQIEKTYDVKLSRIISGDIEHRRYRPKEYLPLICKLFSFWEKELKWSKPDVIIGGMERFNNLACTYVSRKFNIPYLFMYSDTIFPNRFIITNLHKGLYSKSDENWAKLKDRDLTEEELGILKKVTATPKHLLHGDNKFFSLSKLKFLLTMTYYSLIDKNNEYISITRGVKNHIKRFIQRRKNKKLYEPIDKNDRIFLFMLSDPGEASITVCTPENQDQLEYIRKLAIQFPIHRVIYVKEHPNILGQFDFSKISYLPNVKIIDPSLSAKEVIKESEQVITVNGRVGFEAKMLGVKVYVLSNSSFYENIRHETDPKIIQKYLYCMYISSYEGNMLSTTPYYTKGMNYDNSSENIKKAVKAINHFIRGEMND